MINIIVDNAQVDQWSYMRSSLFKESSVIDRDNYVIIFKVIIFELTIEQIGGDNIENVISTVCTSK